MLESKGYQQSERELMQFKVGDRVEAIKGPSNTQHDDYVGQGTVIAYRANNDYGEDYQLALDMGEEGWWFAEESLRPLQSKPTPTPSITVGTQVRLTGVVARNSQAVDEAHWVNVIIDGTRSSGLSLYIDKEALEVIRQPFKRGEVVYAPRNPNEDYVLVKDEWDGKVLLAHERTGMYETDASLFERRP